MLKLPTPPAPWSEEALSTHALEAMSVCDHPTGSSLWFIWQTRAASAKSTSRRSCQCDTQSCGKSGAQRFRHVQSSKGAQCCDSRPTAHHPSTKIPDVVGYARDLVKPYHKDRRLPEQILVICAHGFNQRHPSVAGAFYCPYFEARGQSKLPVCSYPIDLQARARLPIMCKKLWANLAFPT